MQEWLDSRLGAVIFYMVSSAGMMIFNKLALRVVHLPIALVLIQMVFTSLVLVGVPSFRASIRYGTWQDAIRWARVIPLLFAVMLASSMIALRHASMGAVVVFRNIAPIFTLAFEAVVSERTQVDLPTMLSLVAALGGVILYSRHDIEFSLKGFLWMLLNMGSAVVERLAQRWMIAVEPIDVSKTGMMLLNNAIGALLLVPLLIPFGEARQLGSLLHLGLWEMTLLLLSCCVGMSISYAGINVQKHLTATAMLVLNNSCKCAARE